MKSKNILQVENISCESLLEELSKQFEKILNSKLPQMQGPLNEDPFITRQDVADMYRITLPTVHSWIHAGILTPYKIGNKTRFLLSEVKQAALKTKKAKEVPVHA